MVSRASGRPVRTLQKLQARVQVSPMIIMVAWRSTPALADVGAGGFLADRDQPVVAHQAAGLVINWVVGRLDADPVRLALDGIVRAVGLLRVAGAVVDFNPDGHRGVEVAGAERGVKPSARYPTPWVRE